MNKRQAKKSLKKRKGYITPRGAEPRKCEAYTENLLKALQPTFHEIIEDVNIAVKEYLGLKNEGDAK